MKKYLYHRIPANMTGTTLYPLNMLKTIHPDIYDYSVKKYEGREHLLSTVIPYLNCLWNDVVFMLAANPIEVNNAYAGAGFKPMVNSYYKIDCDSLDHALMTTMLDTPQCQKAFENYHPFDIKKMDQYSQIPPGALQYFRESKASGVHGRNMLPYRYITHIFYMGTIDVSNCEIVTL